MKISTRVFSGTVLLIVSLSNSSASAGLLDTCFDPGSGADGAVYAHAIQCDGKIIIGGSFTSIAGAAHSRIARLNPDGSLDSSFNPTVNYTVCAIALQSDGK